MKKLFSLFGALILSTSMWAAYYMAGNGSATNNWCCGVNWSVDGCEMTDGAYSTKVPAGTYEFKITEGNWQTSYGASSVDATKSTTGYEGKDNVKFTVASEANINVTFDGKKIVLTSDVPFGSVVITSWTIAGVQALMGSDWSPSDTNNDMSLVGGAYQLVKENVTLTAGDYDYKAAANHAWGIKEVPASGNQTLTISANGTYNVTFSLDAQGTSLSANAELAGAPEVQIFAKNNWDVVVDWTWKEMTEVEENTFVLDSVVFGGTGVNINDKTDDSDAQWFPQENILGDSIAAKDTVKLVYSLMDSTLTATLLGRPLPPAPAGPKYFLAGGMSDWEFQAMTLVDTIASLGVALPASALDSFKIVKVDGDTTWFGAFDKGATMTIDNSTNWALSSNGYDIFIQTTKDTVYTFQFNVNTISASVVFPAKEPEQPNDTLTLHVGSWANDDAKIAAWVWAVGQDGQWTAFFAGEEDVLTAEIPNNSTNIKFVRFANTVEAPEWKDSFIWNQSADLTIDPCLEYFANGYGDGTPSPLVGKWCSPTPIEEIAVQRAEGKILRDGQLYIICNGVMYNAVGARSK